MEWPDDGQTFWQRTEASLVGDTGDLCFGSEPPDAMDLDNLWPSKASEIFTDTLPQLEVARDTDRILPESTDQLGNFHSNSDPTNLALTDTTPSSQLPPSEVPPSTSHTIPVARSVSLPFRCSWHPHGSSAPCHRLSPDRPAFLGHLGALHQVSGQQNAMITCQLYDHKTMSVCNKLIKRGNFPRHADTHYLVRYYCQQCPPGKSFSRQDSWKTHVKDKHT